MLSFGPSLLFAFFSNKKTTAPRMLMKYNMFIGSHHEIMFSLSESKAFAGVFIL